MLFTKIQFSAMCGMESNKLSVYVSRGKVVISGDKIDTAIKQNAEFLEKWQKKNGVVQNNPGVPEIKVVKDQLSIPDEKDESTNISDSFNQSSSDDALTRANKYLQLQAKEIEIRLKLIDEEKKRGELIPTEFVKSIISSQARSAITAFKDALELLIIKISAKKQLTLEETAALRGEMIEIINGAIDNSVNESKRDLKKLTQEFSESKNVGEHA